MSLSVKEGEKDSPKSSAPKPGSAEGSVLQQIMACCGPEGSGLKGGLGIIFRDLR